MNAPRTALPGGRQQTVPGGWPVPPLFHGTRRPVSKGGLLLPADLTGAADNHGLGRTAHVYLTPDRELACAYARAALGRGRPRLLRVCPLGPLEVDDSTFQGDEQESYRVAEGACVLAVTVLPEMPWDVPPDRGACAGRSYLEAGRPVLVLLGWRGPGPRNVLIEREDGSRVVRPFRGLRKLPPNSA